EQRRHLECPGEAALDPRRLRELGDLLAGDEDLPGAWAERPGDEVDKACLAGAVWPDQRMAGAALEPEIDRIGDLQRAKALAQPARLECRPVRLLAHRRSRSTSPKIPPRAKTTTSTINSPIPKYQ